MDLRYSSEALQLRPRFYNFYNEIDIYVEDEDQEVFYEHLLQRLLDNSVKVRRVFGLGGKVNLFRKVDECMLKPPNRKKFFIADGDFDRVLKRPFPKTDLLHVLTEYCIENFLFESIAVYSIMQEEVPDKTYRQLKAVFNATAWLEDCINSLTPLFASYILIQKYNLGIKNVKKVWGLFFQEAVFLNWMIARLMNLLVMCEKHMVLSYVVTLMQR